MRTSRRRNLFALSYKYVERNRLVQDATAEPSGQAIVEFAAGGRQRQRPPTVVSLEGQRDAFSALDGLWALLRRADELRAEHPKLLAAVLSALVSLFQVGARPLLPCGAACGARLCPGNSLHASYGNQFLRLLQLGTPRVLPSSVQICALFWHSRVCQPLVELL